MNAPEIYLDHQIDITAIIDGLSDAERIRWIKAIVATVGGYGTIGKIREIINDTLLDD